MDRLRRQFSGKATGFTLVEVLVAGTILVLGILPTLTAFAVSYTDITYGGRMSRAVALAERQLEQIKSTADASAGFPPSNGTSTSGMYSVSWTVSSVGFGAAADDLRRINMSVTWVQNTRPGRYDVVAFVSKPYGH
jgi:Tfp pilus assembly protein PilV